MNGGRPEDLIEKARALAPRVREAAAEAEQRLSLPKPLVEAMAGAGVFRMTVPKALGGLEVDPLTSLCVIEELGYADAAAGWCAMIASSTAHLTAMCLPEQAAREVFGPSCDRRFAGTIIAAGMALKSEGGYQVTGRWKFGSFAGHSDWLASNTFVSDDGASLRMRSPGAPYTRTMLIPTTACEILDTWHVTGMRGTGSHDYATTDRFVPEALSFCYVDDGPAHPGPLYAFRPLFLTPLGILPLAATRCAIDQVAGRLEGTPRAQGIIAAEVAEADALVRSGRAFLFQAVEQVWNELVAGRKPSLRQRAMFRLAITNAHAAATRAIDLVFSANGGTSIYASDPIERLFRDVHTMTTHGAANLRTFEQIGAMLFGAEPVGTIFD